MTDLPAFRFIYTIHRPIDHWDGAIRLDDIGKEPRDVAQGSYGDSGHDLAYRYRQRAEALSDFASALHTAALHSRIWEGDIRGGLSAHRAGLGDAYAFAMPSFADTVFIAAWGFKQDNNGTTFIVSRVRMPWLDEHDEVEALDLDAPVSVPY